MSKEVFTTAGQKALRHGLRISEVSRTIETSQQTMSNWNKHKPKLLKAVLAGCKAMKRAEKDGQRD